MFCKNGLVRIDTSGPQPMSFGSAPLLDDEGRLPNIEDAYEWVRAEGLVKNLGGNAEEPVPGLDRGEGHAPARSGECGQRYRARGPATGKRAHQARDGRMGRPDAIPFDPASRAGRFRFAGLEEAVRS